MIENVETIKKSLKGLDKTIDFINLIEIFKVTNNIFTMCEFHTVKYTNLLNTYSKYTHQKMQLTFLSITLRFDKILSFKIF